jgi:hypothetical protein
MIVVTPDYAARFHDMSVKNHDRMHMTGDRIKILLLNLLFMLRDLTLPEVMCTSATFINKYRIRYRIPHRIQYCITISVSYLADSSAQRRY